MFRNKKSNKIKRYQNKIFYYKKRLCFINYLSESSIPLTRHPLTRYSVGPVLTITNDIRVTLRLFGARQNYKIMLLIIRKTMFFYEFPDTLNTSVILVYLQMDVLYTRVHEFQKRVY